MTNKRTAKSKEDRTPRTLDTRETEAREDDSFTPPNSLPDPYPEEGYVFRWVRVSTLGKHDARNFSVRHREGWEPVLAKEHPEVAAYADQEGRFYDRGNIEIGGLVLCKMSEKRAKAREAYYTKRASQQIEAADANLMRQSDARAPLLNPNRKTDISFGSPSD